MQKADGGRRCANCGLALKPNAKFCGGCGTPIDAPGSEIPAINREMGNVSNPLDSQSRGTTYGVAQDAGASSVPQAAPQPPRSTIPTAVPGPPPSSPPTIPPALPAIPYVGGPNRRNPRWAIAAGFLALFLVGGAVAALILLRPSQAKTVIIYSHRSTTTTSHSGVSTTTSLGTSTSTAPTTARQEAQSFNALLISSSSDRTGTVNATNDISNCGNLSQDEATLQSSEQSRQMLLDQLSQLDTAKLPNSAQLVATLTAAWNASEQADSSYAAWAGDLVQTGCVGQASTNDPNWQAAQTANAQATAAKTEFVMIWNSIATTYGLPTYTQQQI